MDTYYYSIRAVAVSAAVIAITTGIVKCSSDSKEQERFKIQLCVDDKVSWAYDSNGRIYCGVKK